jgi:hypothetical protein
MFIQPSERKVKKKPVRAQQWQLLRLRELYRRNARPSEEEMSEVALETGLSVYLRPLFRFFLLNFMVNQGRNRGSKIGFKDRERQAGTPV